MKAKVTKQFRGVPEGEVYPKLFNPGDVVSANLAVAAIENGWGEQLAEFEETATPPKSAAKASKDDVPPTPAPPVVRAKLTRKHVHNGESYARGLIVEGDIAREFVAAGVAELIAPDDKQVTSVPETK